jgi:CRP/FNR family transcriptional regulator, cyclic AMP receptor protein
MSDSPPARIGTQYAPGEVLFHEGERGDVMYVVQSGAVRISKHVAGQDKLLAVLGPGEFFGEMAILNGKPRTATATAVEPTRCLVIEPQTLEDMVVRNAEIALRLIKKLAKRLDSADTLVEVLLHRDPKARVLMALSRHAETFGDEFDGGVRVRASVREIADEVAVDPRVAEDMMKRVRRLGIAHEEEGGVVVTDVSRLRDFVEFLEVPRQNDPSTPPSPSGPSPSWPGEASSTPLPPSRPPARPEKG